MGHDILQKGLHGLVGKISLPHRGRCPGGAEGARCVCLLLLLFFTLLAFLPFPHAYADDVPEITADSAILIEAETGRVIWEKDADARRYPASMTKMMTALLAIENLPPHAEIPISKRAAETEDVPLDLHEGDALDAEELLRGMMLRSDNGAAVAFAEKIDGTVPRFADRMNARAAEIGMTDTHFANPNGLTDPNHYSTARDMAKLARCAMTNPDFRAIVRLQKATVHWKYPKQRVLEAETTNELLGHYAGLDGIKTGWTEAARGCLAASAKRGNLRLIAIVMHSREEKDRFTDMAKILDYGFAHAKMVHGASKEKLAHKLWVKGGTQGTVGVMPEGDLDYPLLNGEDASHYTIAYEMPNVIAASIKKGQSVGKLILKYDGEPVGSIDMLASESVPAGFSFSGLLVTIFSPLLNLL